MALHDCRRTAALVLGQLQRGLERKLKADDEARVKRYQGFKEKYLQARKFSYISLRGASNSVLKMLLMSSHK